jgi:hypothetical protein
MTNGVTDGMFLLNKKAVTTMFLNYSTSNLIQVETQVPIVESIIETMIEPIIYKC